MKTVTADSPNDQYNSNTDLTAVHVVALIAVLVVVGVCVDAAVSYLLITM